MDTPTETGDSNVRVAVRVRPFNSTEKANGEVSCVTIHKDRIVLANPNDSSEDQSFAFDLIFDQTSQQTSVWNAIGAPILTKAFQGYNGTIFAYGQTGSGKTWSMQGVEGSELQGIIPRLNHALFEKIEAEKLSRLSVSFLVTASYFEIYNEVIFDLLDANDRKKKPATARGGLEIKEHPVLGVYVKGLQEIVVESAAKLQKIIDSGMKSRTVASTQMNADSSRSHSVFVITVRQKDVNDESKNIFAKVDLAGSERVKSTGASGATLKEGANINKSLSELGNVINALVAQAKGKRGVFVPYRNSKLTRVLQESLGGNSITAMLAALSPAGSYFEETLSTLKYANRAKAIKVNAVKNEEASQVSKLNDEIRLLKERLEGQNVNIDTSMMEERHRQQLLDLEEAMKSTWEAKAKSSEEFEKERKRLETEQRSDANKSVITREKEWLLLEQKGDLDLSLNHLKEVSKTKVDLSLKISDWSVLLKEINRLEGSLGEQYTVVNIYRSALEGDNKELMKTLSKNPSSPSKNGSENDGKGSCPFDKATSSLWRQFNDKFHVTRGEVDKWIDLQNRVLHSVQCLGDFVTENLSVIGLSKSNPESDDDSAGYVRGLQMLSRQLKEKYETCIIDLSKIKKTLINFSSMKKDLGGIALRYEGALKGLHREEEVLLKTSNKDTSRNNNNKASQLIERMCQCRLHLSSGSRSPSAIIGTNETSPDDTPSSSLSPQILSASNMTLDCGVNLSNCNGEIDLTAQSLGQVIKWPLLLKKTPPEKFLERPPVRFLFDLFVFCAVNTPDLFPQSILNADWTVVSSSKQEKIIFMDSMLVFLSSYLGHKSPTTAVSIVAGIDVVLTNILLQHLSIAILFHQNTPVTNNDIEMDNGDKIKNKIKSHENILFVNTGINDDGIGTNGKGSEICEVKINGNVDGNVKEENILQIFETLQSVTALIIAAISYMASLDDTRKLRKQEEFKKQMDRLANEKIALEVRLSDEKKSSYTEKEGLAEELRGTLQKLGKLQTMYDCEHMTKIQLEDDISQIELEKMSLHTTLQEQLDGSALLKTDLLKLQASHERNRLLIDTLKAQKMDEEGLMNELMLQRNEAKFFKQQWDTERDDFSSQIIVLTEEKDSARNNEENLFEQLSERTIDLEILQESYVDMTDRCNDAYDEIADLKEKLQEYQIVFKERNSVLTTSSTLPMGSNPTVDSATDEVTGHSEEGLDVGKNLISGEIERTAKSHTNGEEMGSPRVSGNNEDRNPVIFSKNEGQGVSNSISGFDIEMDRESLPVVGTSALRGVPIVDNDGESSVTDRHKGVERSGLAENEDDYMDEEMELILEMEKSIIPIKLPSINQKTQSSESLETSLHTSDATASATEKLIELNMKKPKESLSLSPSKVILQDNQDNDYEEDFDYDDEFDDD